MAPLELVIAQHRTPRDKRALGQSGHGLREGGAGGPHLGLPAGQPALRSGDGVDELRRQFALSQHGPLVTLGGLSGHGPDEILTRCVAVTVAAVAEESPRFPEVRLHGAVRRVEEPCHLVEAVVLRVVQVLVHGAGGGGQSGVLQGGADVGGGHDPGAQGEVHTGREQRIDEAGGVADEDEALAHDALRDVRPVAE